MERTVTGARVRGRAASSPAVAVTLARREVRYALTRDRPLQVLVLVAPLLVVAVIGAFGPAAVVRVGVVGAGPGCPIAAQVDEQPHLSARRYPTEAAAHRALEVREVAAIVITESCASGLADVLITPEERVAPALRAEIVAATTGARAPNEAAPQVLVVDVDDGPVRAVTGWGFSAPAAAVLLLFLTALGGGAQVMHARQLGLGDRYLAMPLRPAAVAAGMTLGRGGVALCQAGVVVVVTQALYGVAWGGILPVGAVLLAFSAASSAAGLLLGTVSRTNAQSVAVAALVGIGAALVGGCVWPLDLFGPGARLVGHATPHAWAMDGLMAANSQSPAAHILGPVAVLWGFTGLLGLAGWLRLRRRLWSGW